MSIYYLYVKTHTVTGLKYLGYTGKKDPYKYLGSGKYWQSHIRVHGTLITTEILHRCQSKADIKEHGLYYSELWNVVNARDGDGKKIWANLKPESGNGGCISGDNHQMKRPDVVAKISGENHYSNQPGYSCPVAGDNHYMRQPGYDKNRHSSKQPAAKQRVQQQMLALGENHQAKSSEQRLRMRTENPMFNADSVRKLSETLKAMGENHPARKPESIVKRSGINHCYYNPTIYHWKNIKTDEELSLTRRDFMNRINGNKSHIGAVIRGVQKQYRGWIIRLSTDQ